MHILTSLLFVWMTGCLVKPGFTEEVCYGDIGCFTDEAPFDVFFRFPPMSPEYINTEFLLYTRLNPSLYMKVDRTDPASVEYSTFSPRRRTVFIIHGFTEKGSRAEWMKEMKDTLLEAENLNVFLVDWASGSRNLYTQSVQNTRVVGRVIAKFIQFLNTETGASFDQIHLIGHSLGAHISGYAGAYQPGIARITGLDPAGPNFRDNDPACRLDPTDAIFVDNIHSDGETLLELGMGLQQPLGDVDFYPNGGKEQPGCPKTVSDKLDDTESELKCSHFRAVYYFTESIQTTQCQFASYPCSSWDEFLNGQCSDCGALGCPSMGYRADSTLARGKFYLQTASQEPYCQDK
ncbi:pancreatic lipase-related protein 2-like [Patiria miniata]|uniref:Lipase domain-containing protein n=1 Tax=Patiria miniata TaxID=46514 RepID=A0A914BCQ8_PATMI|nr:pancreatic lipase-related protein 2-like [Patiria miniata]